MAIVLSEESERIRVETKDDAERQAENFQKLKESLAEEVVKENERDSLNKEYFDYYDGIINSYELEKRKITGEFITSKILEQDIEDASNLTGRIYDPDGTVFDPIRIPEFDGGNLEPPNTDTLNEERYEQEESDARIYLETGFSNGGGLGSTESSINSSSSSFLVDGDGSSFSIGQKLVIANGSSCIIEVTGKVTTGVDPNEETTVSFVFVEDIEGVPFEPSGSVGSGATISRTLAPFTDGERDTKTASNPNFQDILDNAILSWETALTGHRDMILAQKAAVDGNSDPDLDQTLSQNLQDEADDFTSYLATLDVSDSGLAVIDSVLSTRLSSKNSRLSAIPGAVGGFYDQRYFYTVLRVHKLRGSLTRSKNLAGGNTLVDQLISISEESAGGYET